MNGSFQLPATIEEKRSRLPLLLFIQKDDMMTDEFPTVDEYFEEMRAYWLAEGLDFASSTWLSLYQITGGNAFGGTLEQYGPIAERGQA